MRLTLSEMQDRLILWAGKIRAEMAPGDSFTATQLCKILEIPRGRIDFLRHVLTAMPDMELREKHRWYRR